MTVHDSVHDSEPQVGSLTEGEPTGPGILPVDLGSNDPHPTGLLPTDMLSTAISTSDRQVPNISSSPKRQDGGFSAFRVMVSTMMLTSLCGVATSKVVALVAGAEGLGLVGLYRTLGQLASLALGLEMTTIIVQRASLAKTPEEARGVFRATWHLFVFQAIAIISLAVCGARPIALWMFGTPTASSHVAEVCVVLLMVTGLLAHRAIIALLEGRAQFKRASAVHIFTSLMTLAIIYPLLRNLGSMGLALIFGSTCLVGALLGAHYVVREYHLSSSDWLLWRQQPTRYRALPTSGLLTLRTVLYTGALMALQTILNRSYGLPALGLYNAAAVIEGGFLLVLMSSMKSYYMPMLARLDSAKEKADFSNAMLTMLLLALLPGASLLILAAPYLVPLVFSIQFAPASEILCVLCLSLVGQTLSWFYTIYLLHRANYWPHVLLDMGAALCLLAGAALAVHLHWPLLGIMWVYVTVQTITACLYIGVVGSRYSHDMLNRRNRMLVLAVGGTVWLAYFLRAVNPINRSLAIFAVLAATYLLYMRMLHRQFVET